jgi:type IV pilus assembly protein PilQ
MKKIAIIILLIASSLMAQGARQRAISLSFENADLHTVLRTFARLGGVNIVSSEAVSGRVTLDLRAVPWEQAFETLLRVHGLTSVEEEGIIGVMTMEESEQQTRIIPVETKIYQIKYAQAAAMEFAISSVLTERGKSKVDVRTASLIVTDIPNALAGVESLIESIDVPTRQVMIEAKIVEIDYKWGQELGIKWRTGSAEPTEDTYLDGGVDAPVTELGRFLYGTLLSGIEINAILSMLESEDKAHILSQPKIAVMDNQEAMVMSGKKIPVITLDMAGNKIMKFYDVALKLTVTPHINAENQIVLELYPEVSDISAEATPGGEVILLTDAAKTTLMVDDGETAVIGGVLREKEGEITRGIPILCKIPLLGRLFKSKAKSKYKSELLVFVTPHIIPVQKK